MKERARKGLAGLGTALGAALLCAGAATVVQGDVEETRVALEKWVETRRILSREERDWELGRELLNDRIEVTQTEIDALRGRIEEARRAISESDSQIGELRARSEEQEANAGRLAEAVSALEARTKALLARLPEPLLERMRQITRLLPEDPAETKLGVGERFLGVVGILNEIDKFQRDLTVASEVRELPDGTTAAVTTVYLGLAQAYYVNNGKDAAGIGVPGEDGWSWTPADEAAPQIARMVEILRNEEAAAFVPLPASIR